MKKTIIVLFAVLLAVVAVSCNPEGECKHKFEVTKAATCKSSGTETCGKCGETREISINPEAHKFSVTTPSTCSVKGKETCDYCGATQDLALDDNAHNVVGGVCTICGAHPGKVFNKTSGLDYDNFTAALAAAVGGDEIVMYKDEIVDAAIPLTVGITIDLNGHTIVNTGSKKNTFSVRHASGGTNIITDTLTIKNGTIKGQPNGNGGGVLSFINLEKVILENLEIVSETTAPDTSAAASIYINAVRDAQIKNCTVTGKVIAYQKSNGVGTVNVTITGGTFVKDPNSPEDAILRITGDSGSATGDIAIDDASFTGSVEEAGTHANLAINSGTWSTDVSQYVPATSSITKDGNVWKITKK